VLPVKGNCYHFSTSQEVTQSTAQNECEKKNGSLLTILTNSEVAFFEKSIVHINKAYDFFWIGLIRRHPWNLFLRTETSKKDRIFNFVWNESHYRVPTYKLPWRIGQPSQYRSMSEECVNLKMIGSRMLMDDRECHEPRSIIFCRFQ
jgi:hypothetical protein